MTKDKIMVSSIGCMAFAIVVEGEDLTVWQWNATNRLAPPILAVGVFVDLDKIS